MNELLYSLFTLLSILALIGQIIILFLPVVPESLRPMPLIVLLICALYFFVRWFYTRLFKAKPFPSLPEHEAQSAYVYFAKRYGVGYCSLAVDCNIRPDGSAQVRRKAEVEAHSELSQLDTFLLIPELPPPGETWSIAPLQIRSLSHDYNVSLINIDKQQGRLSALIAISPQLGEGQSVTYEMIERLPAGLYAIDLTEDEQAKRKTPHDYFGWFINRPTRNLSLVVYFPEGIQPEVYGLEVRYASVAPGFQSERLHYKEQGRLAKPTLSGPEGGRYVLKLDVEYPMIGLVYILRWQPLKTRPKKTPEQMEQAAAPAEEIAEAAE